jgi:TolA-binding protein
MAPPPPVRDTTIALAGDSLSADELRLRRAAEAWSRSDFERVVNELSAIEDSVPTFPEADRAAFLLGEAYLRLGSRERLDRLAAAVSRWPTSSVYTRWLATRSAATAGDDSSARARLAQSVADQPLGLYLRTFADTANDRGSLARLADTDTTSALGRDLVGAARLRLATLALAHGEDPTPSLTAVPHGSRYAIRARHMAGLWSIERGDTAGGLATLRSVLAEDSTYAGRREVLRTIAAVTLASGRWDFAGQGYRDVDSDWRGHHDALAERLATSHYDDLWTDWQSRDGSHDRIVLDPQPLESAADQLAAQSADLRARPTLEVPPPQAPPLSAALRWPVEPPPPESWALLARSSRAIAETHFALDRTRWLADRERERLADWRRYLGLGVDRAHQEADEALRRAVRLDSLHAVLDSLDARIRATRDRATRHLLERAAKVLAECEKNRTWMDAMRLYYLDGPNRDRPLIVPPGYPGPDTLLQEEAALSAALQAAATALAADTPGLIARSYQQAWRPNIVDRVVELAREVHGVHYWAAHVESNLDSGRVVAQSSDRLRELEAETAQLSRASDSLQVADDALRSRIAKTAVERQLASLENEREAIDYGLATAAYGSSVTHRRAASTDTASLDAGPIVVMGRDSTASDTLHTTFDPNGDKDPTDDPETIALRTQAITSIRGFLEQHPQSAARGEMRFRLADLLLSDARQSFRERMANYLRAQSEGRNPGPLPVLDQGPALELYRAMLAEDRDYAHLDAVLMNAGSLLADQGDPAAAAFFEELVRDHPSSIYVQEANLRLGDLQFDEHRFAECVDFYKHAAEGSDRSLKAIALYKLGWAYFNQDQFLPSADAFRSVLDVYEQGGAVALNVDIKDEAEAYLIHTLARAGGAEVFAHYFDGIGPRPYEMRVLQAMGQHFRRFSLYGEAAASDSLCVSRYPKHADALVSAERLVETYQRWERPELARRSQLDCAPRFAPRSAWATAQSSDSVRAAGEEFARHSWLAVARYHHLEARDHDASSDWQMALQLYETLLSYWPADSSAASYHLSAGEAGAHLKQYPLALSHYGAAAATGTDSLAQQAMFQRVAVTDAWYESTRNTASGQTALGSDSLAHAVLARGDEMVARFPNHKATSDVYWRQGNLAFAHGWYPRAASDLDHLVQGFPNDSRTPAAAMLRADAFYRLESFEDAGAAFEVALAAAQRAHNDSLVHRAEAAIPACYYRAAETVAAHDTTNQERVAGLFAKVATRWPNFPNAHLAQYRAGLAYEKAGNPRQAVAMMQALIERFPKSEYVKDAHLKVATIWENAKEPAKAAEGYTAFANRYPDDESAGDAWLKAADLFTASGQDERAEEVWMTYIRKYPQDLETAMEILEKLSRKELAQITPEHPISNLLGPSRVKGEPASHLADYLARAASRPDLASKDVLAHVKFLEGEEAQTLYGETKLTQPLEKSIPVKQKQLDQLIAKYRSSVDYGIAEWANASAYRIGEALVGFGEALERSERPADLQGDDLAGYEDVIGQQAQAFYDRGEAVWTDLLRQKAKVNAEDPWIARAQHSLWQRLGGRFYYRPEVEFPLVAADVAPRIKVEKAKKDSTTRKSSSERPEKKQKSVPADTASAQRAAQREDVQP